MSKIISIHEYALRPEVDERQFEQSLRKAQERGLLRLPELVGHYFIKGVKGSRRGSYAAIWIYESREAWERLWGSPDHPLRKQDYPAKWKVWEEEVLAPFLNQAPDRIVFTAYEELG
jgi:hypothetical protein